MTFLSYESTVEYPRFNFGALLYSLSWSTISTRMWSTRFFLYLLTTQNLCAKFGYFIWTCLLNVILKLFNKFFVDVLNGICLKMPLPLIKLGSLFVKTLSKPLANAIKRNVKTHPRLSDGIAIPAQGVFNFYLLFTFLWCQYIYSNFKYRTSFAFGLCFH